MSRDSTRLNHEQLSAEQVMQVSPVIPVIALDDADQAINLAHALIEGGIKVLEITLRTKAALTAIRTLSRELPEAVVGAGTVLDANDLLQVRDAGAAFSISPGSTPSLLETARKENITLLPGVATASEIMLGLGLGYTHFKLFPAITAGGIGALKSFAGPFQTARFCPTGGINEKNYREFLKLNNVLCIGGSWVAPTNLIRERRYDEITRLAKAAVDGIA